MIRLMQSLPIVLLTHPKFLDTVRSIRQDHELEFDHQWKKMHLLHAVEFDNEILPPGGITRIFKFIAFCSFIIMSLK